MGGDAGLPLSKVLTLEWSRTGSDPFWDFVAIKLIGHPPLPRSLTRCRPGPPLDPGRRQTLRRW